MSFSSRTLALFTAALVVLPAAGLGPALAKKGAAGGIMKAVDTDNDGTIDLKEVQTAAAAAFVKLDPDKDGTLDAKELKGRLKPATLKQADPDGDGTLDQKEFLALAESLFKSADPDNDGTLDAKELNSPAGKALSKLLK